MNFAFVCEHTISHLYLLCSFFRHQIRRSSFHARPQILKAGFPPAVCRNLRIN